MTTYNTLLKMLQELDELLVEGQQLSDKIKIMLKNNEIRMNKIDKYQSTVASYKSLLSDNIMWKSRKIYFEITQSFIVSKINGIQFQKEFKQIYIQNMTEHRELRANIESRSKIDLTITSKSIGFAEIPNELQHYLDRFDPDLDDSQPSSYYALSESDLKLAIIVDIIPKFSKYSLP